MTGGLQHDDIAVRTRVAEILGEIGDLRTAAALIEALEDDDPGVRMAAVAALKTISGHNYKQDVTRWRQWYDAIK